MNIHLQAWDMALIFVVSLQATLLAYLPSAQWKAFVLSLPVPFTVSTLAVGLPLDATNAAGLFLLLIFTHAVRWLFVELRWPIMLAIVASAAIYCVLATGMAVVLPRSPQSFWLVSGAVVVIGIGVLMLMPQRREAADRSLLPLVVKLPMIVAVVVVLVLLKQYLRGFMTVFPMVGVIGAYEARNSLWTMGRQIPVVMLTMTPMMVCCYLTQSRIGLPASLALSWVTFGIAMLIFYAAPRTKMWEVR